MNLRSFGNTTNSSSSVALIGLDLDGTVIDCRTRQVAVASWAADQLRLGPLDEDRFWALKRNGATTREAFRLLGAPPRLAEHAGRIWSEEIENSTWLLLDKLLPGAMDALIAFAASGGSSVLLTARHQAHSVQEQTTRLGLDSVVDDVIVVEPLHAVIEKSSVLQSIGAELMVGDSESDAEAAGLAALPFLPVCTGQRSREFLRDMGHSVVYGELASALHSVRN